MIDDLNITIRQIQISFITGQPNTIITWFNDLWAKLSVVEINVYHCNGGEFIYYYNNDVMFYYDETFKTFLFSFKYYRDLSDLLNLQHLSKCRHITNLLINNNNNVNICNIRNSKEFSPRGLGKTRNVLKQYLGYNED